MKKYFSHFTNEGAEVQLDHTRFDSEATDVFSFTPVPHGTASKRAVSSLVHPVSKYEALVIIYLPDCDCITSLHNIPINLTLYK